MSQITRADLLGYLLGALDGPEQERVASQIEVRPGLRSQLVELKHDLAPLEGLRCPTEPPAGLARRTCSAIATQPRPSRFAPPMRNAPPATTTTRLGGRPLQPTSAVGQALPAGGSGAPAGSRCRTLGGEAVQGGLMAATSLRDTLVSAAVLLILGSVAVVALNESRFQSRLLACQNNLRQIGQGLLAYSSVYEGAFVPIPREGNLSVAGAFAPILLDAGFLDDSALLFCSGGGSAAGTQRGIPSSDEVLAASGQRLVELQRRLAGDYGYTLGYYLNGSYQPASNMGRKWYVLVADAPASDQPGRQSANHGRRGQNCLFEDGRVQFVTGGLVPATTDAIYENDHGMVAPGLNPHDVVIAPSHVSPYPAGVVSSVAP